jgi:ankyrin repeat protein
LLLLSLMQHPDFLSETDREGRGLMHWLVAHDHVDSVRALIALGEKDGLLQTDSEGNYPSHLVRSSAMLNALWNENFESLDAHHEKLLTPVYELRNKDGRTPLHLLAQQGNADAVSTYVDRVCPEPSNLAGRIYDSLTYNALDLRDRKCGHDSEIGELSIGGRERCGPLSPLSTPLRLCP